MRYLFATNTILLCHCNVKFLDNRYFLEQMIFIIILYRIIYN